MNPPIPIQGANMLRLRDAEEDLDQILSELLLADIEMRHLGDTDAHVEFDRLKRLVEQAHRQAVTTLEHVTEARENSAAKRGRT